MLSWRHISILGESTKGSILRGQCLREFRSPNDFDLNDYLPGPEFEGSLMILPSNGTAKWETDATQKIQEKLSSIFHLQVKIHDNNWNGKALVEIMNDGGRFADDLVKANLAVVYTNQEDFKWACLKLGIAEKEKSLQRLQKENKNLASACSSKNQTILSTMQELSDALAASEHQREQLQNDLTSKDDEIQRLKDLVSTMKKDHEAEIKRGELELENAHTSNLSALQAELTSLKKDHEQGKVALGDLQEVLAKAKLAEEMKDVLIKKQDDELVVLRAQNSAYDTKLITSDQKVKSGREELDRTQKYINFLQQQVSELQGALTAKEDVADKRLGDRMEELAKFQESIVSKEDEVRKVDQQADDCAKEINDVLSTLKEKSDKSQEQIERFGDELMHMKSAVAALSAFDGHARSLMNIQQQLAMFHENSELEIAASKAVTKSQKDESHQPLELVSNESEELNQHVAEANTVTPAKEGTALEIRTKLKKRSLDQNDTECIDSVAPPRRCKSRRLVRHPTSIHDVPGLKTDNNDGDFHDANSEVTTTD